MNSITENYKRILVPIIVKHVPQAKIILYGSRARNDAQEGSDIDIALDMGKKIEGVTMAKIMQDVEDSDLPIKFDIVDFHILSEHMQREILKDGLIWQK